MANPLTEEGLAEIVRAIHFYYGSQTRRAARLITALRASRAEVERLQEAVRDEMVFSRWRPLYDELRLRK